MLDEETSEEVEEDGTDTSMKRSRLSGRRARKRKEQGGGKIKEENDSQLLTNSFSQVPTPPFSLFVIGMEPCLVLEWKRTKLFFLCLVLEKRVEVRNKAFCFSFCVAGCGENMHEKWGTAYCTEGKRKRWKGKNGCSFACVDGCKRGGEEGGIMTEEKGWKFNCMSFSNGFDALWLCRNSMGILCVKLGFIKETTDNI